MRIATVNVNGIRAAARKGMGDWLEAAAPDVLLLQEVRADPEIAAPLLPGYEPIIWPCRIKGRAGVAVAVREGSGITVGRTRLGVAVPGSDEPDVDSGRWLEADLALPDATPGASRLLTVISAYLHSGQIGTEKMEQKYAHLELVDARMAALLAERAACDGAREILMAGDLNVVRSERDIKNWKPNHNKVAGVLDDEIAHLESWFDAGWIDISRHLHPDAQGPYTWWSQRGKAFDNNVGWRLDYQVVTPGLAERAKSLRVDRAEDYQKRWSDHAPLVVDYRL
ncbi:exodeoxyribonuclease III [Actinomyces gaoshouyii]|uniref:Exodeoxyribonuclease III n=1 Tax=Actinomyces gaoshouyii TaxID=1960083 RepID=A0A8H9HDD2_9ACTO|nr:exodeoxyribonuclease III [Actinomyces gaoshouyii]ARD42784.1 exodeoxyribonuclease III [Actinomyces gaoshouyii]GGO96792.1 exodeoxyribonuclease III [Actinomyces gaoshouyii]